MKNKILITITVIAIIAFFASIPFMDCNYPAVPMITMLVSGAWLVLFTKANEPKEVSHEDEI